MNTSTTPPPDGTRLVMCNFRGALLKLFTPKDIELFCFCEELVAALFEEQTDLLFNCHAICRAIAQILPELSVITGGLTGYKENPDIPGVLMIRTSGHSWLQTPDGALIDPYPVGFITWRPVMFPTNQDSIFPAFGASMYNSKFEKHGFKNTQEDRKRIKALVTFWKRRLR